MLAVLDILDRHNFDRVDNNNSIEVLYTNIFSVVSSKEGNEVCSSGLVCCVLLARFLNFFFFFFLAISLGFTVLVEIFAYVTVFLTQPLR